VNLGVDLELSFENIQFLKKQHLYDLQYTIRENHLADFVLLPEKMFDSIEEREKFNYLAILTGFICGALQTMNFAAQVYVEKDALQQVP